MTDIKQVSDWALTIAAEAAGSKLHHYERMADDNRLAQSIEAHARAIEQHEKFKWEVSYAALSALKVVMEMAEHDCEVMVRPILERFIIAKPDPLVEALEEASGTNDPVEWANRFYAAIEKRGGKIVWGWG